MLLKEIIYKRKSVRKYKVEPVSEEIKREIEAFYLGAKPLYPDIKVRAEILNREEVKSMFAWTPSQVVVLYSEEKDGYLENAGFLLQQLELYLGTLGLGACWLGMGKPEVGAKKEEKEGLKFVIMLAFGYPNEELYRENAQFKRKALSAISDREDERLEAARLAPSSVNSQPWYFTHEGELIHAYCSKQGLLKWLALGQMNRIDMGIALANLYVENPETFRFFRSETAQELKGHKYVGSFTL